MRDSRRLFTLIDLSLMYSIPVLEVEEAASEGKFFVYYQHEEEELMATAEDFKQWVDRKDDRVTKCYSQIAMEINHRALEDNALYDKGMKDAAEQMNKEGRIYLEQWGVETVLYENKEEVRSTHIAPEPSIIVSTPPELKEGKPPLSMIWEFREALEELSMVQLVGSKKYGKRNWMTRGYKATERMDSLNRHLAAWMDGEKIDPEDQRSHLIKIAINAMMVYMIEIGKAQGEIDV